LVYKQTVSSLRFSEEDIIYGKNKYGTTRYGDSGTTTILGHIKAVIGVLIANVKTINGVAIANVKSFLGVSNVD